MSTLFDENRFESEIDSKVKTIVKNEISTTNYYSAKVIRKDSEGVWWVRLDGNDEETPVLVNKVDMSVGDMVTVMVRDHQTFVDGNLTSPPMSAANAQAYVNTVVARDIKAVTADIGFLKADVATIGYAQIEDADITNARIQNLVTQYTSLEGSFNVLEANALTANSAVITNLQSETAKIENLTAENLEAAVGYIEDLTAENIQAADIIADHADITNLEADNATIKGRLTAAEGNITNLTAADATITGRLTAAEGNITNLTAADATITGRLTAAEGNITNLTAADATITGRLEAAEADVGSLQASTADIGTIRANSAKVQNLTAEQLSAATGYVGSLTAGNVSAADIIADHATISDLDATYATIDVLESDYITASVIESNYTKTDFSNTTVGWIQNGVIKNAAITNEMVQDISANKLTAGTINGSVINVTNLNADNITAGTINGQRIGTGSLSLDKLSEDVYTEAEVDSIVDGLNDRIDGAIESHTGNAVPTLQNSPASSWNTSALKDEHVGDVYYVVNSNISQNGYCYRFTKSGTGASATYSWQLIKDSDVTAALSRLQTAEGKIGDIEAFDVTMSTFKTNTEGAISTLQTKTTNLETSLGDKVSTSTFNELSQTVDGNSSTITTLGTVLTNNGLTTSTNISNTVNSVQQTANANSASITSLTTTTQQLRTDLDNIDVGARNLLRWTGKPTVSGKNWNTVPEQTDGWSRWDNGWTLEDTTDGIKGTRTSSTTGFAIPLVHENAVVGGEEYTLSFDYRTNMTSFGSVYLLVASGSNVSVGATSVTQSTSTWQHYEQTLTWGSTSDRVTRALLIPYVNTSGGWLEIKDRSMKLEKGNHATDWSPAPEDLESDLATFKTTTTNKFNTVDQTLNGIETSIGSIEDTLETKADGSTVSSLSSQVNTMSDTVAGHTQSISSINTTLSTKADGSTVSTLSTKVNNISDTVDGHTTQITQVTATANATGSGVVDYSRMGVWEQGTTTNETVGKTYAQLKSTSSTRIRFANEMPITPGEYQVTMSSGFQWYAHIFGSDYKLVRIISWTSSVDYKLTISSGEAYIVFLLRKGTGTSNILPTEATDSKLRLVYTYASDSEFQSVKSDYATFKQTVNEFQSTIGTTYATKTELGTETSNRESAITQLNNQLSSKVDASDVYTKTQTDGLITTEVNNRNSAINQKASEITASVASTYTTKTEFENLEIGGRNLLRKADIYCYSAGQQPNLDLTKYVSEGTVTYSRGAIANEGFYLTNNVRTDPSTEYIISFDAKCTSGSITQVYLYSLNPDNTTSFKVYANGTELGGKNANLNVTLSSTACTSFEIKYTTASTVNTSGSYAGIIIQWNKSVSTAFTVEMTNLKWEKGNKATDWTPAPEDIEAYTDAAVTAAKAEIKVTTDNITSEVSKVSSVKYVNSSTASWTLANLKTYAAEGHSENWNVSSTANLRVGDTVYVKGTDSTRGCQIYIKTTVTSVNNATNFTGTSHGYEDVLPVDTIKSTINQSADSVKIQANHVEITGTAVFNAINNDTGQTKIDGGKIDATSITIGASTLPEAVLRYDITYSYDEDPTTHRKVSATFTAHLYQGATDIKTSYPESSFTWFLKSEDWIQGEPMSPLTSNGDYTCTVLLADVGYGAVVVGRFEPPNDAIALDDDDNALVDDDDVPISVRVPSGDYVRIADLEVTATVFNADKMLIVTSEGERLATVSTLKAVFGTSSYNDLTNRPQIGGVTLTGNKSLQDLGIVPTSRTINGHALSSNVTITKGDVGLGNVVDGAEINQNAFSNVKVGSTNVAADAKTDTLEFVGSNVTLTPDAANDKVTIGITASNVTTALGNTAVNRATADASGNNIASTYATKNELGTAVAGALQYKGTVDTESTITSAAYKKGWYYVVSTAGTYVGKACEVGDMLIAKQDKTSTPANDWDAVQSNIEVLSNSEIDALWAAA